MTQSGRETGDGASSSRLSLALRRRGLWGRPRNRWAGFL